MANENDFATKFTLDGSEGRQELQRIFGDLKKLIPAAKQAGDAVDASAGDMAKQYVAVASAIERVETMMDRLAASQARRKSSINVADANDASATSKYVYGDDANKSKAAAAAQKVLNLEAQREVMLRQQANRDLADEQRRLLINAQIEEVSNRARITSEREAARLQSQAAAQAIRDERARQNAIANRARAERSAAGSTAASQRAAANSGTERTSALAAERAGSLHDVSQINATRYALYDVASTAALVGGAIAGIGTSSIVAATQAETAFAQVRRAMDRSGLSTAQFNVEAGKLRSTLLDLTTQMPASFAEVAGTAQLGAQLGIANQDLDEFTTTVTKFAATTNVSVDSTGEAFGRLGQLLHVPASDFEALGSSIYTVGIKSAATESEILSLSQQIAGAASAYKVSAQDVVGLSSTFASLAIAPEAARGSITRIFGDIETGAAEGGAAMKPFADLLHMTSEEAASLWKQNPGDFFDKLIQGLSEAQKQGNLLSAIKSIGANDVRDVNLLQRLATNSEFLTEQLGLSRDAFKENTSLAKGYDEIAGTLAAKLEELWNSVQKLAIQAGGPFLGALGGITDLLKIFVNQLSNANPVLLSILTGLTLLVGGFILLRGAQAAVLAGILALRFVLQQLGDASNGTGVKVASLRTQMALLRAEMTGVTAEARATAAGVTATGTAASGAGRGMTAFGLASKAVGWAGLILLVGQFTGALLEANKASIAAWQGINKVSNAAAGAKLSIQDVASSFKQAKDQIYEFQGGNITDKLANSFGKAFGVNDYVSQAQDEIKAIDDRLAALVAKGNGDKAAAQVKAFGISAGEVATFLPNYSDALDAASAAHGNNKAAVDANSGSLDEFTSKADSVKDAVDSLFGSLNTKIDMSQALQKLYSGVYDAGTSFSYLNESGVANLQNLQAAIIAVANDAQATGGSTTDALASMFIALAQQGVNVQAILDQLKSNPVVLKGDIDMSAVYDKINAAIGGGINGSAKKVKDAYKPFNALDLQIGFIADNAPRAANGLSGVGTAAKKAAREAKEAEKEIRTLGDYVSDLSTVLGDANQYRFGVQDALDDISQKWTDIQQKIKDNNTAMKEHADKVKEARLDLAQYRADLAGLAAQLTQKQYFLKIAVQYGDNLRGQALNADISDLQAQMADKSKDIADKQKEVKEKFEGTSQSAVEQRGTLSELYKSYQTLIEEYARGGLTQDQLKIKTEELRQKFIQQATQAGFSKAEIKKYSDAFVDLRQTIEHVPRNITVKADTRPAMQALNDFLAKANKAKAKASIDAPDAGASGYNAAKRFTSNFDQWMRNWNASMNETKKFIDQTTRNIDQITKNIGKIDIPSFGNLGLNLGLQVGRANGGFVPGVNGFPIGGFVPGSTPADRRRDNSIGLVRGGGVVGLQGGEPIINNAARSKYGDHMFDAINSLNYQPNVIRPVVNVQGGGRGDGPIDLSQFDRSILMEIVAAVRSGMVFDSSAAQNAANGANVVDSRRRRG